MSPYARYPHGLVTRVVVIGGGFGGMAAAARLAKLGHEVTLLDRGGTLGGELQPQEHGDLRWDLGPTTMALPGAVRDLFRKSGRPLEKMIDLVRVETARRHLFPDGTVLDLPVHSRSGQTEQIEQALGRAAAESWTSMIDGLEETWELLRTRVLEVPYPGARRAFGARGLLRMRPWRSLHDLATSTLRDPRTARLLTYVAERDGGDPRRAPWFLAVHAYVERTFGLWTCEGGLGPLVEALTARLAERGVEVRPHAEVVDLLIEGGAVTGVRLADGERISAPVVVSAIPSHRLLSKARTRRLTTAPPIRTFLLAMRSPVPDAPFETVVHGGPGEPTLVVRAPLGSRAWTLRVVGGETADPLRTLADRGVEIRDQVESQVVTTAISGEPMWLGARTARFLAPHQGPYRGLYHVGPTAHPGPGLPSVLLGAATVAQLIGKADD